MFDKIQRGDDVAIIKEYQRRFAKGQLSEEATEMLLSLTSDDDQMTTLFSYIDQGGMLPKGWEKTVEASKRNWSPPSGAKKIEKALPRTSKEKPVKKAPHNKASSKKAGSTGKTRYSYPQEDNKPKAPKKKANPVATPPPEDDTPPSADPTDLANQLHMSVATLQRIAQRFVDNQKLGGRKGFMAFMKTRLKDFAGKHRIDGDYWGLIFTALTGQNG